jgi:cob(I)alamin adenosyltransferase
VGGQKVPKDSPRIEAYGAVDELNAVIGLCKTAAVECKASQQDRARLEAFFRRIQNELFNLGSDLATRPEDLRPKQPVIEQRHIDRLERECDELLEGLPELRSFTLPGGGWLPSFLHLARTVCRRAERRAVALARQEPVRPECVKYLNRLSDALFVLGRWAVRAIGEAEPLWEPEKT